MTILSSTSMAHEVAKADVMKSDTSEDSTEFIPNNDALKTDVCKDSSEVTATVHGEITNDDVLDVDICKDSMEVITNNNVLKVDVCKDLPEITSIVQCEINNADILKDDICKDESTENFLSGTKCTSCRDFTSSLAQSVEDSTPSTIRVYSSQQCLKSYCNVPDDRKVESEKISSECQSISSCLKRCFSTSNLPKSEFSFSENSISKRLTIPLPDHQNSVLHKTLSGSMPLLSFSTQNQYLGPYFSMQRIKSLPILKKHSKLHSSDRELDTFSPARKHLYSLQNLKTFSENRCGNLVKPIHPNFPKKSKIIVPTFVSSRSRQRAKSLENISVHWNLCQTFYSSPCINDVPFSCNVCKNKKNQSISCIKNVVKIPICNDFESEFLNNISDSSKSMQINSNTNSIMLHDDEVENNNLDVKLHPKIDSEKADPTEIDPKSVNDVFDSSEIQSILSSLFLLKHKLCKNVTNQCVDDNIGSVVHDLEILEEISNIESESELISNSKLDDSLVDVENSKVIDKETPVIYEVLPQQNMPEEINPIDVDCVDINYTMKKCSSCPTLEKNSSSEVSENGYKCGQNSSCDIVDQIYNDNDIESTLHLEWESLQGTLKEDLDWKTNLVENNNISSELNKMLFEDRSVHKMMVGDKEHFSKMMDEDIRSSEKIRDEDIESFDKIRDDNMRSFEKVWDEGNESCVKMMDDQKGDYENILETDDGSFNKINDGDKRSFEVSLM